MTTDLARQKDLAARSGLSQTPHLLSDLTVPSERRGGSRPGSQRVGCGPAIGLHCISGTLSGPIPGIEIRLRSIR